MISDPNINYSYLYGLSDFWVTMFQDPDLVNKILEAQTVTMSEVYSHFLQLTSTLSLDDISITTQSQIKLITFTTTQLAYGASTEFEISPAITSAKVISDRPFLPLKSLEDGVDYKITNYFDNGVLKSKITFSKSLETYQFPYRVTDTGKYEFALWASDVTIDEQLISNVYANIIKIDPDFSTNTYKDYVKGLFFLYTHGPNIDYLSRGLSLAIGIPLARTRETVLLTTRDNQTGRWIVVTDQSSYTLPYNVAPTVERGQVLEIGTTLSKVVEVKDYMTDNEWWLNIFIPKGVLPAGVYNPVGGGTATPGSDLDYLMRNFLKSHTFLVVINWQPGYNISNFENLRSIISRVKPAYTVGIYAWKIPLPVEEIEVTDEEAGDFDYTAVVDTAEDLVPDYIHRDGDLSQKLVLGVKRKEKLFIHSNTDPDSGVYPRDVDTVDPAFTVSTSEYLGTVGPAITTTYSKLLHLYNAKTSEVEAKLTAHGVSFTSGSLPYKFALYTNTSLVADLMSRDGTKAPGVRSDYYSPCSDTNTDNLLDVQFTGWETELHRSFMPATDYGSNSYLPITLVFTKMNDHVEVWNVMLVNQYGLAEEPPYEDIYFPIQKEETLTITTAP